MAQRPSPQEVHAKATQVISRLLGGAVSPTTPSRPVEPEYRVIGRLALDRQEGRRVGLGASLPQAAYVVLFGDNLEEVAGVWSISSSALRTLAKSDGTGEFWLRMTSRFRATSGVEELTNLLRGDGAGTAPPAKVSPSVGDPWTEREIEAALRAYEQMLDLELRGERYSKAEIVRAVQAELGVRSAGSIERKLQNVSAVLDEAGIQWIDGYKPLAHYQSALRTAALAGIGTSRRFVETLAAYGASALVAPQSSRLATDDVLVGPPGPRSSPRRTNVALTGTVSSALTDFRTRSLGLAGEQWVIDLERERLKRWGLAALADRVQWTSQELGDAAGYDVSSYWPDGRDRLIEVKTTNFGPRTPFYITRWEVETSRQHANNYSLYRVHGFARDPKIYVLDGSIEEKARLEPKVYLGLPR